MASKSGPLLWDKPTPNWDAVGCIGRGEGTPLGSVDPVIARDPVIGKARLTADRRGWMRISCRAERL